MQGQNVSKEKLSYIINISVTIITASQKTQTQQLISHAITAYNESTQWTDSALSLINKTQIFNKQWAVRWKQQHIHTMSQIRPWPKTHRHSSLSIIIILNVPAIHWLLKIFGASNTTRKKYVAFNVCAIYWNFLKKFL